MQVIDSIEEEIESRVNSGVISRVAALLAYDQYLFRGDDFFIIITTYKNCIRNYVDLKLKLHRLKRQTRDVYGSLVGYNRDLIMAFDRYEDDLYFLNQSKLHLRSKLIEYGIDYKQYHINYGKHI